MVEEEAHNGTNKKKTIAGHALTFVLAFARKILWITAILGTKLSKDTYRSSCFESLKNKSSIDAYRNDLNNFTVAAMSFSERWTCQVCSGNISHYDFIYLSCTSIVHRESFSW